MGHMKQISEEFVDFLRILNTEAHHNSSYIGIIESGDDLANTYYRLRGARKITSPGCGLESLALQCNYISQS